MVLRNRNGRDGPATTFNADTCPDNAFILVVQRARKTRKRTSANILSHTAATICAARDGKHGARWSSDPTATCPTTPACCFIVVLRWSRTTPQVTTATTARPSSAPPRVPSPATPSSTAHS